MTDTIKLTYCKSHQGYNHGNGERWLLEFTCKGDVYLAINEVKKFSRENFTSGQILFIDKESIVHWYNPMFGGRFSARLYSKQDAMLLKLVYG